MTHERAGPVRRGLSTLGFWVLDNWGMLSLLAAWEAWIGVENLNSVVLPHSWDAVADVVSSPVLYVRGCAWTVGVAVTGLVAGFVVGGCLAVACWFSRFASGFLSVAALIVTSVPVVAFIPIIGRLLGYDTRTDVAIVAVICFFPFFVLIASGLENAPAVSNDLLTVLGGTRRDRLRYLALPSALPACMVALRLAAPSAVLAALASEYLMGTAGLGSMVRDAMAQFDSSRAIGASLVAAAISLLGFSAATRAEAAVRRRYT